MMLRICHLWALAMLTIAGPALGFEARERVVWPVGAELEFDGGGSLRVVQGGRTLLRTELAWSSSKQIAGALPADALTAQLRHWNYYHVDDIVFLDARLDGDFEGSPALVIDALVPIRSRGMKVRPYLSAGRAPEVEPFVSWSRYEEPDGERLYLAVVRLDRAKAEVADAALTWKTGSATWPLAIVAARTEASMRFAIGQALWTYDRAGEGKVGWRVPPLCGHCQNPQIDAAQVDIEKDGDQWRVEVRVADDSIREHISGEGLRLGGSPLGRYHLGRVSKGDLYRIPAEDPLAARLVALAQSGGLDVEFWTDAGNSVFPALVEVDVPAAHAALPVANAPLDKSDLPNHLAPRLVSAWPNPFRETTTIEVEVPQTMDAAFDLDDDLRTQIKAEAEPPFGLNPSVRVRVYNVTGQLVQVLEESSRNPGSFSLSWDGVDLQGRPVAAGAYYVNVEMGEWSVTRRILRLKN